MIEKIPKQNTWGQCLDKINELVDAVNEFHKILHDLIKESVENMSRVDSLENAVLELRAKVNKTAQNLNFAQPEVKENVQKDTETRPKNAQSDPYKWVGKLCRFRHCDDTKWKYGILKDVIYDTSSCLVDIRYKMGGIEFRECEPVKPDDDIIFKGE